MNRTLLTLLTMALLSFLPTYSRAQYSMGNPTPSAPSNPPADKDQNAGTSDTDTNTPMKKLMLTTDQVTNTVGVVLKKISPTLWVGVYEVTQPSYKKVMGSNPSAFQGKEHPVDSVSWDDAMDFCQKLTDKENKGDQLPEGYIYALPTEAQWEQLVGNASLNDAVMSLHGSRRGSTAPVGSLGPNNYGLYDMRGNVMEWCLDAHDPSYHVLRGGGWDTIAEASSRLEFRWYAQLPDKPRSDFGFRVVLEPQ